jgi:predicted phosphodiesterase
MVAMVLLGGGRAEAAFTREPWIQDATTTSVAIYWEAGAAGGTQRLEYGPQGQAMSQTVNGTLVSNMLYKAVVTGLPASTAYDYQVVSNADTSTPGSFVSAPSGAEPFRFAVFGDTRPNVTPHQAVVAKTLAYAPDFVLNTGDLVDATNYTEFFKIEKDLLRNAVILPAPGNHDTASLYQYGFDRPNYYAFRWGNAFFLSISTDDSYQVGSTQYQWIEQQLQAAHADPTIQWIVAYHHFPVYSSGEHGSTADMQTTLNPLYKQYGVDLVFNGHDHIYQRVERDGIEYFVSGGGGAPLYTVSSTLVQGTQTALSANHTIVVDVDGGVLDLNAYKTDGTKIDSVHLEKGPASGGGTPTPAPTDTPSAGGTPDPGTGDGATVHGGAACDVGPMASATPAVLGTLLPALLALGSVLRKRD